MLTVFTLWSDTMQDLIGRCFSLQEGSYRIVDVRRIGSEAMVYAEEIRPRVQLTEQQASPRRSAFHYLDIASLLRPPLRAAEQRPGSETD